MKIELTKLELRTTVKALSHWRASLISQSRDDSAVKIVLDRSRRSAGDSEEE